MNNPGAGAGAPFSRSGACGCLRPHPRRQIVGRHGMGPRRSTVTPAASGRDLAGPIGRLMTDISAWQPGGWRCRFGPRALAATELPIARLRRPMPERPVAPGAGPAVPGPPSLSGRCRPWGADSLAARIERVAQAVTEQVEREHGDENRHAGPQRHPGGIGHEALGRVQHGAPGGSGWLQAQPQE